jgi:hypothetical protein
MSNALIRHFRRLKPGVGDYAKKIMRRVEDFFRGGPFRLHPRVPVQLKDPRLGTLAGKLTIRTLNRLLKNPNAQRLFDTKTGHVNVIQMVDKKLLRITVLRDANHIISVGPIKPSGVANGIRFGRFIPLE